MPRRLFKTTFPIDTFALAASMVGVMLAGCSGDDSDDEFGRSNGSRGGSGGSGGSVTSYPIDTAGTAATDPTGGTSGMAGAEGSDGFAGSDGFGGSWSGDDGDSSGGHMGGGTGGLPSGGHSGGGTGGLPSGGHSGGGSGGAPQDYLCQPACAAGEICCPVGIRTKCMPFAGTACGVPDLTVSDVAAQASLDIDFINTSADPCLLEEACVAGPGVRRVLVFDTETPNIGTGDLVVGEPSLDNPDFEFSSCHGHYHFDGFATYDLLDATGKVVAAGHKQSFCMRDDARVLSEADVRTTPRYRCDGGVQGISRGWSDVYGVGLPCQWVDITGVPAGDYFLRVRINPDHRIYELDYDNNESVVPVTIP